MNPISSIALIKIKEIKSIKLKLITTEQIKRTKRETIFNKDTNRE